MRKQRGIAAITAILIVAVAASAAAMMLAQQSALIDQAMLVASRAQADQYARAGTEWARGILAQDARAVDSLGEGWAQPMAGLPVERALVSGAIVDEQGKFNLNNLVANQQPSTADIAAFGRLLSALALPTELTDAVVDWIDADGEIAGNGGAEDSYYLALPRPYRAANQPMMVVDELYRVRGFDAQTVAKLRPYVTALPERTLVNANTASDRVLEALLPGVPPAEIERLIAARVQKPFTSIQAIGDWARALDPRADTTGLDVKSAYFSVVVQVAQDDVQVASEALVRRDDKSPSNAIIWRRPRY